MARVFFSSAYSSLISQFSPTFQCLLFKVTPKQTLPFISREVWKILLNDQSIAGAWKTVVDLNRFLPVIDLLPFHQIYNGLKTMENRDMKIIHHLRASQIAKWNSKQKFEFLELFNEKELSFIPRDLLVVLFDSPIVKNHWGTNLCLNEMINIVGILPSLCLFRALKNEANRTILVFLNIKIDQISEWDDFSKLEILTCLNERLIKFIPKHLLTVLFDSIIVKHNWRGLNLDLNKMLSRVSILPSKCLLEALQWEYNHTDQVLASIGVKQIKKWHSWEQVELVKLLSERQISRLPQALMIELLTTQGENDLWGKDLKLNDMLNAVSHLSSKNLYNAMISSSENRSSTVWAQVKAHQVNEWANLEKGIILFLSINSGNNEGSIKDIPQELLDILCPQK